MGEGALAAAVSVPYRIRGSDRARGFPRERRRHAHRGRAPAPLARASCGRGRRRSRRPDRAAARRRREGRARGPRDPRRPYLGETLRLVREGGDRVPAATMLIRLATAPALQRWYRRRAKAEVGRAGCGDRACRLALHGLTIRLQRTRWASCSSNGAMSSNWRVCWRRRRSSTTWSSTRSATSRSWTMPRFRVCSRRARRAARALGVGRAVTGRRRPASERLVGSSPRGPCGTRPSRRSCRRCRARPILRGRRGLELDPDPTWCSPPSAGRSP